MEELINLLHTGGYSCTIANYGAQNETYIED